MSLHLWPVLRMKIGRGRGHLEARLLHARGQTGRDPNLGRLGG